MISVEEARARILDGIAPLEAVEVAPLEALGQTLASDVRSGIDIPPLANTGMDGYAVRAADTRGATPSTPRELRVAGYLAAGAVFPGRVGPGEAVRIMTGAPIPEGADSVVPFEETDEQEQGAPWREASRERVRVDVEARPGANIRPQAEDVRSGELVMPSGTVVGEPQVGVLASLGLDRVEVVRRPRVAVLSTGDELVRPGKPLPPGSIYDANAFSLAAQVLASGGLPRILDVARDTADELTAAIRAALSDADLLVTSAGVSRGDFDIVKEVLAREGEIGFWTVRMRPGKPLAFGSFPRPGARPGRVPHLGLPGNPVSAMMTFELFGRAVLYTMLGRRDWERPRVRATARERIENPDGRRVYARAVVSREQAGRYVAALTGPQGSGVLTSMARANGYAVCPEDRPAVEPGEECEVLLVGPVEGPEG